MTAPLWEQSRVSLDRTHHVIGDCPMYAKRFLEVLSFHKPGLAAVRDQHASWHIDIHASPVYSPVFINAFGFYENLAAVQDSRGWFHVKPSGTPAYTESYDWCGNFQNGQAVVRESGRFFHILPSGQAAYHARFLYAGDFRERRAVVRLIDGRCAHIDANGRLAYPFRYHNLGVYHKGFACAQDANGWTHINLDGTPIYKRRFATLEPFYNEFALAEAFDGKIVTINRQGQEVYQVMDAPQK